MAAMMRLAGFRSTVALPAVTARRFISASSLGIQNLGIKWNKDVHYNMPYDEIAKHEVANGEGIVTTQKDCFAISTAPYFGRSPKDKWVVKQEPSSKNIDWNKVNQPITAAAFDDLHKLCLDYYNTKAQRMYVFDGYCGSSKGSRKSVRFITAKAWQHHFVTNMFIRPTAEELKTFKPDFTIINACEVTDPNWKAHNLNSEVFVAFNIEKNLAIIGGTHYGGEMKKGMFSMMNYWLPLEGKLSMHCSANKAKDGSNTALFFGLSGTGKTSLSADENRLLIGDDEHGWDDQGIFNFEGGCYAKTIGLNDEEQPTIFRSIRRDALLENVKINNRVVDFNDESLTQNGRVSYPIFHVSNYEKTLSGGHPENIIFLACDAYGILPPVSRLSPDQAMYHFLSGYTAKIPGTERGVREPEPTFSACFGAVFLPLHPFKYADLLKQKMQKHGSHAWLVNTGWGGGSFPNVKRLPIGVTRKCIDAILDGSVHKTTFAKDPIFQFEYPTALPGVESRLLNPREGWADKAAFDATARKLAKLFITNFDKFGGDAKAAYAKHGPILP